MLVFDTNVLVYSVNEDSEFYLPCRNFLDETIHGREPAFVT